MGILFPWVYNIMVNHGPMWHCDKACLNMKINHGQLLWAIVNHGPTSHCEKDCLNMKINHGQPCSIMINHGHIVTKFVSWSNVTLWQPWSSVALRQRLSQYEKLTLVNHGRTSHCNKDSLNMKNNHGQP